MDGFFGGKLFEKGVRIIADALKRSYKRFTWFKRGLDQQYPELFIHLAGILLCICIFIFFMYLGQIWHFFVYILKIIFFIPKKLIGFAYSLFTATLYFILAFIKKTYFVLVVGEEGLLHFLLPITSRIIFWAESALRWLVVDWGWWYLTKWTLLSSGSYWFYRWFRYSLPKKSEEDFIYRGATVLFFFRLRTYSFKNFWKAYSEAFWDGVTGLLMLFLYVFHQQFWALYNWYFRYPAYRQKVNAWFRKKFRRPFVRFFIRLNWAFGLTNFVLGAIGPSFVTFSKLLIGLSAEMFFIISIFLLIWYCWLNLYKFFCSRLILFILNRIGFRFPRPSLYTQPVTTSFWGSSPISKVSSVAANIRLNSLVDLKHTNVYLLDKIFGNSIVSVKYSKKETLPKDKRTSYRAWTSHWAQYRYWALQKDEATVASLALRFNWFGHRPRFNRLASLNKPMIPNNVSKFRAVKLKGSILLPKLVSNKFDLETFVLRQFLLSNPDRSGDNLCSSGVSSAAKDLLEFHRLGNSGVSSIPKMSFFDDSNFYFFDKSVNRFIKNRRSNLLSDVLHMFLRYNINPVLSRDKTFVPDNAIIEGTTGGSTRYPSVQPYHKRLFLSSAKFLHNFKILIPIPTKGIKLKKVSPSSVLSAKLAVKERAIWKYWGKGKNIWRPIARAAWARTTSRLIHIARIRRVLSRGIELTERQKKFPIRPGKRKLRKFLFTRYYFNKFPTLRFEKKRHKISANTSKGFWFGYTYLRKYNTNRTYTVSPAVIPNSVNRLPNLNFTSFSSSLLKLRRHIFLFLKYKNKKKFFKHGARFLVRSHPTHGREITKGRQIRRLFAKSSTYLSFLRSVYSRNTKLLLTLKAASSFLLNEKAAYLPLFSVSNNPWWFGDRVESKYFNFHYRGARSKRLRLGRGYYENLHRGLLGKILTLSSVNMYSALPGLSYYEHLTRWPQDRTSRSGLINLWYKDRRIHRWFYKNYGIPNSVLFTKYAKDHRKIALDYRPTHRFGLRPPFFLFEFHRRRKFFRAWRYFYRLFFFDLGSKPSAFLYLLFLFGIIVGAPHSFLVF